MVNNKELKKQKEIAKFTEHQWMVALQLVENKEFYSAWGEI